jgi:hypothetical protein
MPCSFEIGHPRSRVCVILAVLAVSAAAPVAAEAATVEVRDGVLAVVQAPGEATSVRVLPVPGAPAAWQVSGPRYAFGGGGFVPGRESSQWPGVGPASGGGCAPLATPTQTGSGKAPYMRCDGVTSVGLSFGAGPDYADVLAGPVTLAGGGGRDRLDACRVAGAVLDGGPGDDSLMLVNGSAAGGPGDDRIDVASCTAPGDPPVSVGVAIDCGPGDDVVRFLSDPGSRGRVDARTCPPVIRPLRTTGRGPGGASDRTRIPADYRLRVSLFRASERVNGSVHLVHDRVAGRPGGEPCSSTVRFRGRPGKAIAATVALSRSLVRLGHKRGLRFLSCSVRFTGADGDGERFGNDSAPSMRNYLLELKGRSG